MDSLLVIMFFCHFAFINTALVFNRKSPNSQILLYLMMIFTEADLIPLLLQSLAADGTFFSISFVDGWYVGFSK